MRCRKPTGNEVAVIGMSGRFPGAADTDQLWNNIISPGERAIRFLENDSRKVGRDSAQDSQSNRIFAVAMFEGPDLFDAEFFGFSRREAELLDPQHRVFLEECWTALESAGYGCVPAGISVGVIGGCTINTYLLENLLPSVRDLDPVQLNIASSSDFLATRVSYKLGLQGPSHVVQSACSTSLLAVHVACRNLLDHECDIALAGGVSVNVRLLNGYLPISGGIMSMDGHCRPFDIGANGTVFGGGAGVVVLKRLTDAQSDGDTIRGVILGSAVNNDGSIKVGYQAPSVEGQAAVIAEALANAAVEPQSVSLVEAHGTGTPVGDPIELRALSRAFGNCIGQPAWCALSSIKGNIGHLDAAAGVTSLIKAILCLENKAIPPMAEFTAPSPDLGIEGTPFYINSDLRPWADDFVPRRVGVSSFGVGGTNVHVIVEELNSVYRQDFHRPDQSDQYLLPVSGRTPKAACMAAANLAGYLKRYPDAALPDVAYTLQLGRKLFKHRLAVVSSDVCDAVQKLQLAADSTNTSSVPAEPQPLIFGFANSFPFPPNHLYRRYAEFRKHYDAVRQVALSILGRNTAAMLETAVVAHPVHSRSDCHPILIFATQYALARIWTVLGIQPVAAVGAGLGEFAAAVVAGVLDIAAALAMLSTIAGGIWPDCSNMSAMAGTARVLRKQSLPESIPFYGKTNQGAVLTKDIVLEQWATRVANFHEIEWQDSLQVVPGAITLLFGGYPSNQATQVSAVDDRTGDVSLTLRRLWLLGIDVNWSALHVESARRRIPLPTYPFERQRFWIDPQPDHTVNRMTTRAAHLRMIGTQSEIEVQLIQIWQNVLGMSVVDTNQSFFDVGGDSVLAIEVSQQIRAQLGLEIPASRFYELLTIRALSEFLSGKANENDDDRSTASVRAAKRKRHQEIERAKRRARQDGGS